MLYFFFELAHIQGIASSAALQRLCRAWGFGVAVPALFTALYPVQVGEAAVIAVYRACVL